MDLLERLAAIEGVHRMDDLGEIEWPDNLAWLRPSRIHSYECITCGYICDSLATVRWHESTQTDQVNL